MSFFYSLGLKLLYPTSLCLLFLLGAAVLGKRRVARRVCFCLAVAILHACGNGWLVGGLARRLEWRFLPPDPIPQADCIVILSGGTLSRIPPRPTVEVTEAGNRVLYGAYLYRQGKADSIICTGGFGPASVRQRPYADDMADLLELLGVPKDVILKESKAANTSEQARNLYPMLQERGFKRVLLITSAMHMPRSAGVLKRLCPEIEFIPAPTDFRVTEPTPAPWYHWVTTLVPTPEALTAFSDVMHEYAGMVYYKMRGWM